MSKPEVRPLEHRLAAKSHAIRQLAAGRLRRTWPRTVAIEISSAPFGDLSATGAGLRRGREHGQQNERENLDDFQIVKA